MLEDEADPALAGVAPRRVLSVEVDGAPVGLLEPGDDPEQARLARARGAEEGDELAVADAQGDVVEREESPEGLRDGPDLDAHGASSPACRERNALASMAARATRVSSDAAANAPWNAYSL